MSKKIFSLIILALPAIYITLCCLGPKDIFTLQVTQNFKASPEELQKWPDWALWLCKKENANITFSRNLRGKGAVMEFSLVNGKGELEIIESEQNKLVHTRTSFKHWKGNLNSEYTIKPLSIDSTQIQLNLYHSEKIAFFMRGIFLLTNGEEKIFDSTKKSLANLQVYLDQAKVVRANSINTN
jgi:hypothetical protein